MKNQQKSQISLESLKGAKKESTISNSRFNRQGLTRFSCGLAAGLLSRTAVAPFERVIIMMQTRSGDYAVQGTFGYINSIYKSEGFRGLFRGNMANVFRVTPFTAFEFTFFDFFKHYIKQAKWASKLPTETQLFFCGCLSGCLAYSLVYPMDVVKTFHSLGLHKDKKVLETLRHLIRENGIRNCYRGLLVTCFGYTPYAGLKLACYQLLVNKFRGDGLGSSAQNMLFGAIAGYVAVTVCYPMDSIKKNYQISILKNEPAGYLRVLKTLYQRNNGISGFYNGLVPTYWKVLPSVALAFTINDFLKSKFLK